MVILITRRIDGDGKEQQKPDDASTKRKKKKRKKKAIGTKIGATTIGKINRRRKHPRR